MKHCASQSDLPLPDEPFRLAGETGLDFERLAAEKRRAEYDRQQSETSQQDIFGKPEQPRGVTTVEEIFGTPIFWYGRAQAIADGVLVDLMQADFAALVCEAGFKFPIAMTYAAFCATIQEPDKPLPEGQDATGRLWDVLHMLHAAIKQAQGSRDRIPFALHVSRRLVCLVAICGPGDNAEPVITIKLEREPDLTSHRSSPFFVESPL